jgi:hypothetical protein
MKTINLVMSTIGVVLGLSLISLIIWNICVNGIAETGSFSFD